MRGYELDKIERLLTESGERYLDAVTRRLVTVGRHGRHLVIVPYEVDKESVVPVTIHATTREQIKYRVRVGRFVREEE